jgi:hypothetical protein
MISISILFLKDRLADWLKKKKTKLLVACKKCPSLAKMIKKSLKGKG